jgi:hypothetical protein
MVENIALIFIWKPKISQSLLEIIQLLNWGNNSPVGAKVW